MRGLFFLITLQALGSVVGVAQAQLQDSDFRTFVAQVLANHPALEATKQEVEAAKAELLSSQGAFDPVLKGEYSGYPKGDYSGTYENIFVEQPLLWRGAKVVAGYRRGGGTFPIYEDYYNTNSDGEARAGIEVPLLRDGETDRRRTSIARALMQIDGVDLTVQQRRVEIARTAAISYWDWVAAARRLETFEGLLATAQQRDRQLATRVLEGDLARIDKVDNERQVLQRKSQQISAQRALQKAENDLSLFLWTSNGLPDRVGNLRSTKFKSPPPISAVPEHAIETALKDRVEHQRIENLVQQQEVELSFSRNQILPRLDVQVLASDDLGTGSTTRDETEFKAGVKLEVPLATRTQRGKIDSLVAKLAELKAQQSLVKQRIAIEVTDAINAFSMAAERVVVARDEVRVAQELEEGERGKFKQGESNLIFVNLREQATADAIVREIDAVADSWKGFITYHAALGTALIQD